MHILINILISLGIAVVLAAFFTLCVWVGKKLPIHKHEYHIHYIWRACSVQDPDMWDIGFKCKICGKEKSMTFYNEDVLSINKEKEFSEEEHT